MKVANKKPKSIWRLVRNRVIAGLFVILPLFITFIIVEWLISTLYNWLVAPIAQTILLGMYGDAARPAVIQDYYVPIVAFAMAAILVYVAGMFFNSRLHRFIDWFLNNVPGVNLIYSAVSNVFDALQRSQFGSEEFKRVVLVEFPHPGMKAPAFVTSETTDLLTGKNILCVYVPTTPVPTSGYMLMVPESDVVALDWDLQETLQAIVSGGLTAPTKVQYYPSIDSTKNSSPNSDN